MTEHLATRIALSPARPGDLDYCARLYFEGMENIIEELNLNMGAQVAGFRQRWDMTQVRIITLDGTDIGWLQSFVRDDALFLGQLFVDRALRRQGIGTEVVKDLIEEAARAGQAGPPLGLPKRGKNAKIVPVRSSFGESRLCLFSLLELLPSPSQCLLRLFLVQLLYPSSQNCCVAQRA